MLDIRADRDQGLSCEVGDGSRVLGGDEACDDPGHVRKRAKGAQFDNETMCWTGSTMVDTDENGEGGGPLVESARPTTESSAEGAVSLARVESKGFTKLFPRCDTVVLNDSQITQKE